MKNLQVSLHRLSQYLLAQHLYIATAESCTGGLLASYLTEQSGSSAWFDRGWITYSNDAKTELLAVSPSLIAQHGAVSEPVAIAMAQGVLDHSKAALSIAITGIAGPTGARPQKPVGTVCIAWGRAVSIEAKTFYFEGDRQSVREQACLKALSEAFVFISSI